MPASLQLLCQRKGMPMMNACVVDSRAAVQDAQDDLKAAAAEALLAVADKLLGLGSSQQQELHAALWEALPDADDLSACTSTLWHLSDG